METVGGDAQPPLSPVLLDELIIDILSRLPVKSLVQFKCVSKPWKSLISHDPYFVKLHLQISPKTSNIILIVNKGYGEDDKEEMEIRAICCSKQSLLENNAPSIVAAAEDDRSFLMNQTHWPVGSCNGLVCFRAEGHFVNGEVTELWVRFWNPALRLTSQKSPSLYFNKLPSSPAVYGFGFDSSSDTYKVVVIILGSQNNTVKVHTMGDHYWRQISSFPAFLTPYGCGTLLSGTLNWLALRESGYHYGWGTVPVTQYEILSLDLEKETYKQLSLPAGLDEVTCVEPGLRVFGDCLSFLYYYGGTHFVIWQMEEFGVGKSWTKLFNISDQLLEIDIDYPLIPLCTSENGDVVVMATSDECEAILYDWRNNEVELIETNSIFWMGAKDYVESLVLPG